MAPVFLSLLRSEIPGITTRFTMTHFITTHSGMAAIAHLPLTTTIIKVTAMDIRTDIIMAPEKAELLETIPGTDPAV